MEYKYSLRNRIAWVFLVAAVLCAFAYSYYGLFAEIQTSKATDTRLVYANSRILMGVDLMLFSTIVTLAFITRSHINRISATQYWTVNVLTKHLKEMTAKGYLDAETGADTDAKTQGQSSHWPWGNHHTEYLGHLEAAASKWWVFYDPSDPTTAPTNETVSDWLQSERNLSRERARAIASMLRPDGLPTGPRK